jgi:hypothetical protein
MFRAFWTTIFGETIKTAIRVKFIDYLNDSIIEEAEIEQLYLPEDFNKEDLSVFFDNKEWLIVKAEPHHALQYSLDKKLKLWLKDPIEAMMKKNTEHPAESKITFGNSTPRKK